MIMLTTMPFRKELLILWGVNGYGADFAKLSIRIFRNHQKV